MYKVRKYRHVFPANHPVDVQLRRREAYQGNLVLAEVQVLDTLHPADTEPKKCMNFCVFTLSSLNVLFFSTFFFISS